VWSTCPRLLPESGTAEIRTSDFMSRKSNALTIMPPGHTWVGFIFSTASLRYGMETKKVTLLKRTLQ